MKILFIGSRLFDDVAYYLNKENITSIVTESNENAINLDLADKKYIVPRGMDKPMEIAIKEDVDAVIPLIGIDPPLSEVGKMKDTLEKENGIPVISSSFYTANLAADKYNTKKLLQKEGIKTPTFRQLQEPYDLENLEEQLPIVLKTPEGQGGTGVKVAVNKEDISEFLNEKNNIFAEEYVEGFEVSIEVLRWNNESVSLCPVYKGDTTLEGIHPLRKIKQAPLNIDGIDNKKHNNDICILAEKIADLVKVEGTMDIDILHDNKSNNDYVIELNTRPSGTRYMTAATTDIYPLCQLVDMAKGNWAAKQVKSKIKNYCSAEIPVGDFPENQKIPLNKVFEGPNSYIVHGPQHYQRVTIRAEDRTNLNDVTHNLLSDYSKKNNIHFN
ncbi:ATP-grasp domain-containing protein [Methanosphaera sp. WGK6]|uniref:ATP-grasp domain-containing protein n=1 Tax=Methanosphaera sp. WGK6 TaxID=1561964 RepID=UPI00084CC760|nr:ATP-grasp domain-containing protein [Methanosphaera sp. WGK6]OED30708.1 carboxylate--amine ligase [Methanosphaera sp. WGK6]